METRRKKKKEGKKKKEKPTRRLPSTFHGDLGLAPGLRDCARGRLVWRIECRKRDTSVSARKHGPLLCRHVQLIHDPA